jgi:hypothetical protein
MGEIDTDLYMPASKRGAPRGKARSYQAPAPDGPDAAAAARAYYPDEAQTKVLLDLGRDQVGQRYADAGLHSRQAGCLRLLANVARVGVGGRYIELYPLRTVSLSAFKCSIAPH